MADGIVGKISVGDGATFTPHVDADGILTFTNNKNLPNPDPVDIVQAVVDSGGLAPIDSPAFTGTPTAPTPANNDNSTKVANTAFVKSVDSTCVHKTGEETIIGQKTFTVGIKAVNSNSNSKYQTQILGLEKGIYPSGTINDIFWSGYDSAGNRIATIQHYFYSSGAHSLEISNFAWVNNSTANSSLMLGQNADGSAFAKVTATPAQSSNTNDIATTAWTTTKLGNYLPLSGGQLTSSLSVTSSNGTISIRSTALEKGTLPSSDTYIPSFYFGDANGNQYSYIRELIRPNGDNTLYFTLNRQTLSGIAGFRFTIKNTSSTIAYFAPTGSDNTDLGIADLRWKEVFATTGTINTSDERLKGNITAIPDDVLDAWGEVGWYQYQFKDAIAEKGESARLHTGAIAQRINSVFESHGLDASRYGLLCYDEWDADSAVRDEQGNITTPARQAGNMYSLRYEEALCMEAAYQRRRADRLEERIARLEALFEAQNE